MGVIENAVAWAIETANDQSHGYSQDGGRRWGPDYDCSSFVISAFEQAGVPLREAGASFTGNMRGPMISCGFADVTYSIGLDTGYGLQPGDVLLNYAAHTCLFIGGGRVANCRTDEGHPQTGDQSGNEIRIQNYWNFPWNCVLRYKGGSGEKPDTKPTPDPKPIEPEKEDHSWNPRLLTPSNAYSSDCVVLQALLNAHHFACGSADGFYGAKTQAAVYKAQQYYGLTVDGICGPQTWGKLLERG